MAELGIFDEEQIRFIQFDEDTEVQIRFIGKEDLTAINRKAEKAARLSGSDDRAIFNQFLAEKCVLGWRNKFNHEHPGIIVNKQPLPFSPENRAMLMKRSIEFSSFVNSTCTNSRLFLEDQGEDQKND